MKRTLQFHLVSCTIMLLFVFSLSAQKSTLLKVDYKNLISRADITYDKPAYRSEEGLPIGNGVTGSLVWTTPSALKFQMNRVDVFANDASTVSFPKADSDQGSSCAYVDINVVDAGDDVFDGKEFRQHLAMYDGMMTVKGKGLTSRIFAYHGKDVIAVEIDDQRETPSAINIDLRMLRFAIQCIYNRSYQLARDHAVEIQTAEHKTLMQLHINDGKIALTQKYSEKDYYNASAVAIEVVGRKSKARFLNESTVQLSAAPAKGKFTILISSASSFDKGADIADAALQQLKAVAGKDFATLASENTAWWANYWSKGFVHLTSQSGQADFVEQNYTYFMYIMGSTSLGKYPPKFNGLLFNTTGDMRRWGSQYWWANTDVYYNTLIPGNRLELIDPVYSMYTGMYGSCEIAAKQQWGSKGIWIPEIVTFKGVEQLPDDIAAELQDLVLARKPYEERTPKFQWFIETKNRHHARWNFLADGKYDHGHYVVPTKGSGIFGHCTHILGSGGRIAELYWQKYEYTLDKEWLRNRAYPMIKGSVELYTNFPNFKKGEDGKYHLLHVNNNESGWNSSDPAHELLVMYMIFPIAIRASEILGIDADLRERWKEVYQNLPPEPKGGRRFGGQGGNAARGGWGAFVYGGPGAIEPIGPEPELKSMFLNFNRTASFIDTAGIGGAKIFRNKLRLREGPGAIDAEHIGGLTMGVHRTMVYGSPTPIAGEQVLQLFNGWPKDWDAAFSLLAKGAFLVSSSFKSGQAEFVELYSQAGEKCQLKNPWGENKVTLFRDGKKSESLSGNKLMFSTKKDETIVLVPAGKNPNDMKREIGQTKSL